MHYRSDKPGRSRGRHRSNVRPSLQTRYDWDFHSQTHVYDYTRGSEESEQDDHQCDAGSVSRRPEDSRGIPISNQALRDRVYSNENGVRLIDGHYYH